VGAALESLYFLIERDGPSATAPYQEGDNEPLMDDNADSVYATDMAQNPTEFEASDNKVIDDIGNESIGSY
jgi:hypothetical protein